MDPVHVIGLILIITALFALGGKVVLYFKNREITLIKEKYEQEIENSKKMHESDRAKISDELFKQNKRTEEHYTNLLAEKDDQIEQLVNEINELKAWKDDLGIKLAKFEGATQGNQQLLVFKLIEHNQKLNRALNEKWEAVEQSLCREINQAAERIKAMFADARKLHQDGLEIISEYEARLPEDFKKKVHEELLQLPESVKIDA
jgi:acyl-CoA synthetase (AMP-forming)/AMP-acid ligase II